MESQRSVHSLVTLGARTRSFACSRILRPDLFLEERTGRGHVLLIKRGNLPLALRRGNRPSSCWSRGFALFLSSWGLAPSFASRESTLVLLVEGICPLPVFVAIRPKLCVEGIGPRLFVGTSPPACCGYFGLTDVYGCVCRSFTESGIAKIRLPAYLSIAISLDGFGNAGAPSIG